MAASASFTVLIPQIFILVITTLFRHCEEGAFPDEAISVTVLGIASGYRPRNDEVSRQSRRGVMLLELGIKNFETPKE
jgi:hypothetical protein